MKCFTICALTILFSAAVGFSQSPVNEWSSVEGLGPGTRVVVITKDGRETKARVRMVTSDRIELTKGSMSVISRSDVQQVYRTRGGSFVTRGLIGAAAGAGIGLLVGAGVVAATKSDPLTAAGTVLVGIPVGATVGVVTTPRKRGRLIYSDL